MHAKSPKLLDGNRDAVIALYDAKNYELAGSLAEKYAAADGSKDKAVREIQVNSYLATKKPPEKLREAIQGLVKADAEAGAKWLMKLAELDLQAKDEGAAVAHAKRMARPQSAATPPAGSSCCPWSPASPARRRPISRPCRSWCSSTPPTRPATRPISPPCNSPRATSRRPRSPWRAR